MAEPIDTRLIYQILKNVQARLASVEDMRGEMREGFASLRAHVVTEHSDAAAFLERRAVESGTGAESSVGSNWPSQTNLE